MKAYQLGICLFILLLAGASTAAQEAPAVATPVKYRLELVRILENYPTEYVFVLGKVGFKSVNSLKDFLGTLQLGSIVEWAPGCIRFGDEPLISLGQEWELAEFRAFCEAKKIDFIVVPSG
jgi:hypothetical protein